MFKTLLKVRFLGLISGMFRSSKQKKQRGIGFKLLVGILAVYVVACFLFVFGSTFYSICAPLVNAGLGWLYFALGGIVAVALCFIGSVFATQQQLFEARDNELLLAMPVPPGVILASRMVMLLLLNYLFAVMVLVPLGVVYCMNFSVTATGVILFVVCALFLPLLVMTLSCLFAWVLALISSRMQNKSTITVILSVLFLVAYFAVFSQLNTYLMKIISNGETIAAAVRKSVFPAYHFGNAIAGADFTSLALFLLCAVIPFAIVYIVLSRSFIRVATARRGAARKKYRAKEMKVSSVRGAMVKKELAHLKSSPMYMLNACMGIVFFLIVAAALIIKRDLPEMLFATMPEAAGQIGVIAVAVLCFAAATNIISAPSISLEGKTLWIAQSMPVRGGDALIAKACMHMIVCVPPGLIASAVCAVILKTNAVQTVLMLSPAVMTVFSALFGVTVNLHFPKFDWINETVVVKQSMSVMIAMFGGWGITVIPLLLYVFALSGVLSAEAFIVIFTAVIAVVCIWMWFYLRTRGGAKFEQLG